MFSRRNFLIGGAGLATTFLLKPSDAGKPHGEYFSNINNVLKQNKIDVPVLVIDLDRLDHNIDKIVGSVGVHPKKAYRIVTKSVPSPKLVKYIADRAETNALMVFHRPFLQEMSQIMPQSDILMGKPMPISAVEKFYREHSGEFQPEQQLQWLVDANNRLNQYLEYAKKESLLLQINLELDVGLHRGGFEADDQLRQALSLIESNPKHLTFSGFMGYDAHLMGIPSFLIDSELVKVKARYASCLTILNDEFPALVHDKLCFNGAGSPTFTYYEGSEMVNEISAGSCLMKPSHYDLPILEDFIESAYIASPVLKRLKGGKLPAFEWTGPIIRKWDVNQRQTYFGYSGNWLAAVESPKGLVPHFAYTSSNQQGYNASNAVNLQVDDFIFLRPEQSEAVLLQFGKLIMLRRNKIEKDWSVLTA